MNNYISKIEAAQLPIQTKAPHRQPAAFVIAADSAVPTGSGLISLRSIAVFFALFFVCALSACSSDVKDASTPPVVEPEPIITGSNGQYAIRLNNNGATLEEGKNINIQIDIVRSEGHSLPVTLAAGGQSDADQQDLWWSFADQQISSTETGTNLNIGLNIGSLPIAPQSRTLRIVGTDGNSQAIVALLDLQITPTSRPDVYLLIGQSNMVGFSEDNARQAGPGGMDETNDRIQQLNVTGNDPTNFNSISAFTDLSRVAVGSPRLTLAIDPLHDGYDTIIGGKEGTRVGLGLSFAKTALANTTASIFLVPAAWADTGFCRRPRFFPLYEGTLGWNPTTPSNPEFSGTLLHDRAIARANLALAETGGILRGILWHQGEADSENSVCANAYEQNMRNLVASLRTNINEDARGPAARGSTANVPFVLGTMSKGGPYADLSDTKMIVDGVHRNIGNIIPHSDFADTDDLIPPTYPCGEGDCIHFGSTSYRQMGDRYYTAIRNAAVR